MRSPVGPTCAPERRWVRSRLAELEARLMALEWTALRTVRAAEAGAPAPAALDLLALDELCRMTRDMSLCGLGQSAPNPVLTSLRHFRHEFEDHVLAKRCRAGVCEDLALSPCENSCPLHMNIPRFLQLYKEDRLDEAFLSVILDNQDALPARGAVRVGAAVTGKADDHGALLDSSIIAPEHPALSQVRLQES